MKLLNTFQEKVNLNICIKYFLSSDVVYCLSWGKDFTKPSQSEFQVIARDCM